MHGKHFSVKKKKNKGNKKNKKKKKSINFEQCIYEIKSKGFVKKIKSIIK